MRVSTELVDARNDNTIWADSYDRDLTDIFAIQSEVAQAIANKLTATLSPEEKKWIEAKPTDNLEAYDLYLRAKELIADVYASFLHGNVAKPLRDAISFLNRPLNWIQSLRLPTVNPQKLMTSSIPKTIRPQSGAPWGMLR